MNKSRILSVHEQARGRESRNDISSESSGVFRGIYN